jgi:hypothetical protein
MSLSFEAAIPAGALIVGFVLAAAITPGCSPKASDSKFSRDDSLRVRFEKALKSPWPADRDEELDRLCQAAFATGEEPLSLEIFEKIEGANTRDQSVFGNLEVLIARNRFDEADAWIERLSNPTKRKIGRRLVENGNPQKQPGSGK